MEPTAVCRPANKGRRYPADPPRVEEIVAVMRQAGSGPHGLRLRGLIVVLWRAGCGLRKRSRYMSPTSSLTRAGSSCAAAKAGGVEQSGWMTGVGNSCAPGSIIGACFPSARCSA